MDDSRQRGAQEASQPEASRRRVLTRLVVLITSLSAFLYFGQWWLASRELQRAIARVEALDLRVGGRDFSDATGKDAGPWIAEVVAARARGDDLLPLADVPAAEGLRYLWAPQLARQDTRALASNDVGAAELYSLAQRIASAVDVDLEAGDVVAAAGRLRALARVIVVLQDGPLPNVMVACVAIRDLEARLAPLMRVHAAQGSSESLADLAAALADVQLAEALRRGLRREAAIRLEQQDAMVHASPSDLRQKRQAFELWASVGEALDEPDPELRARAFERLAVDLAHPRWDSPVRVPSGFAKNAAEMLRRSVEVQLNLDDFRARYGAGR